MPTDLESPSAAPRHFLSTHSLVLECIAADPAARERDPAARLGLTERAVPTIVADLAAGGYLTARREGRRSRYTVHPDGPLPNPPAAPWTVADRLAFGLGGKPEAD